MLVLNRSIPTLLLLASALAAPAPARAGAREDVPDDVYLLAQPEPVVQSIRAAGIERSVQSVNWFIRGFARQRLQQVATACPAYQILVRDPHFEVICDGETVFEWQLGQTGTWTTETGDVVGVTLIELKSAFELRFDAGGGQGKTFHYAWDDVGNLTVTQQITSPRLPVPVRYALQYRADGLPTVR